MLIKKCDICGASYDADEFDGRGAQLIIRETNSLRYKQHEADVCCVCRRRLVNIIFDKDETTQGSIIEKIKNYINQVRKGEREK